MDWVWIGACSVAPFTLIILAALRALVKKEPEQRRPALTDEELEHLRMHELPAGAADFAAYKAKGKGEFPLRLEGNRDNPVLRNGSIRLSLYFRPSDGEWPYVSRTDVPDALWTSFAASLQGKFPSEIGPADVQDFWQSLPPFQWGKTKDGLDAIVSAELQIPVQRDKHSWPILAPGEIALGLWPEFLQGLLGRKPSEMTVYLQEFKESARGAFRWRSENDKQWLTNGQLSFPKERPARGQWSAYGLTEDDIGIGLWNEFLSGLEGQHPDMSEYMKGFNPSLPRPFRWVQEGGVFLTDGRLVFRQKRPSRRGDWLACELPEEAVPKGLWPEFLAGLEGKQRQMPSYLEEFLQSARGPFRWVREDNKTWLTDGETSLPRERPRGALSWRAYGLKAVKPEVWLSLLTSLKGERLTGKPALVTFLAQATGERNKPLVGEPLELQQVLANSRLRKARKGVEWVVVEECILFTVPRIVSLGTLYVLYEDDAAVYLFASLDEAADLICGFTTRAQVRHYQCHIDRHDGWTQDLEDVLATVKSKNLKVDVTARKAQAGRADR